MLRFHILLEYYRGNQMSIKRGIKRAGISLSAIGLLAVLKRGPAIFDRPLFLVTLMNTFPSPLKARKKREKNSSFLSLIRYIKDRIFHLYLSSGDRDFHSIIKKAKK